VLVSDRPHLLRFGLAEGNISDRSLMNPPDPATAEPRKGRENEKATEKTGAGGSIAESEPRDGGFRRHRVGSPKNGCFLILMRPNSRLQEDIFGRGFPESGPRTGMLFPRRCEPETPETEPGTAERSRNPRRQWLRSWPDRCFFVDYYLPPGKPDGHTHHIPAGRFDESAEVGRETWKGKKGRKKKGKEKDNKKENSRPFDWPGSSKLVWTIDRTAGKKGD